MSIADFFKDPIRAYGLMMFLVRAKEESIDANVVFDAHAADFGLALSDYFQSALDQDHPRLRQFSRGPAYFLNEQDPVFLALQDKMRELLSRETTRRSVRGREKGELVRSYFSPFRLSKAAEAAALTSIPE